MGEPWASPGGGPLAARGSGVSSKLEGRLGPDSHRAHRDGRDSIRRRSLSPDPKIGMTGAEAPWVRSVRTSHLWWGSVAGTEVPEPGRTLIHPGQVRPESALLPFRRRRSAPGTPTGVTRRAAPIPAPRERSQVIVKPEKRQGGGCCGGS
jgi:hypothetical protein